MFKALLQKQLLELNQSFFQNKKTGKRRSATSAVISIILFAVLIVAVIGGMFFILAQSMSPLITGGFGWLYITILSLLSIVFGVFGSVFNTYASVYQAKDNDLLLSLPIPVPYILAVRLSGVYLMGLMYSAVVSVPSLIVYCMYAKPAAGSVIGYILLILLISVLVLVLSCALGWVVAKISSKLKNKSLITVIASLAFIAVYYVLYFRATELLQVLIANVSVIGNDIRSSAYPLYMLGRCGEGDVLSLLIYAAVILSLFALT